MDNDIVQVTDQVLETVQAHCGIACAERERPPSRRDRFEPGDLPPEHEETLADLRDHVERLRRGDTRRLSELRALVAPTGVLRELASTNGWVEEYLPLADRFDHAVTPYLHGLRR